MSLRDIIRINQLIRNRIDIDGFKTWHASLSPRDQDRLTSTLFDFAYQAGANDVTWDEVLSFGGLTDHAAVVEKVKSFHLTEIGLHDWSGFQTWFGGLHHTDKHIVFVIAILLFGIAEGAVFQKESAGHCSHWWHRDLLDPRVVQAILTDPEYYRTSMKHDESIKT